MTHAHQALQTGPVSGDKVLSLSSVKIAIIGAGQLARSLLSAWQSSLSFSTQIYASTASQKSLDSLHREFPDLTASHLSTRNETIVPHGQLIILCVKPDKLKSVLVPSLIRAVQPHAVIVSLIAGIHEAQLKSYFEVEASCCATLTFLRAIPNVASAVTEGLTSLYSSQSIQPELKRLLDQLFSPVGLVNWLAEERLVNPSIALGSSAPAFVAMAAEGMVQGALAAGIPRTIGLQMAAQILIGIGKMLLHNDNDDKEKPRKTPSAIIDSITTPGGCTIAGLLTLERGNLRALMADAILSTTQRLEEKDAQTSSLEAAK